MGSMQREKLSCRGQVTCPSSLTEITTKPVTAAQTINVQRMRCIEPINTSCSLPSAGPVSGLNSAGEAKH